MTSTTRKGQAVEYLGIQSALSLAVRLQRRGALREGRAGTGRPWGAGEAPAFSTECTNNSHFLLFTAPPRWAAVVINTLVTCSSISVITNCSCPSHSLLGNFRPLLTSTRLRRCSRFHFCGP